MRLIAAKEECVSARAKFRLPRCKHVVLIESSKNNLRLRWNNSSASGEWNEILMLSCVHMNVETAVGEGVGSGRVTLRPGPLPKSRMYFIT